MIYWMLWDSLWRSMVGADPWRRGGWSKEVMRSKRHKNRPLFNQTKQDRTQNFKGVPFFKPRTWQKQTNSSSADSYVGSFQLPAADKLFVHFCYVRGLKKRIPLEICIVFFYLIEKALCLTFCGSQLCFIYLIRTWVLFIWLFIYLFLNRRH